MSEHEIENIKITPRIMEYTVELPDRELQWEKCPAYVTKIKIVKKMTSETKDGLEVISEDVPMEIAYTEMAMEDMGTVGAHGEAIKNVVKLSDVATKVSDTVALIDSKGGKIGKIEVPLGLTAIEQKKVDLADALVETFADEEGFIDERNLKAKATWGLGCPANCGGFKEFRYADMNPQIYYCENCNVKITLVDKK
jgi:hypothetical protein